MSDAQLLAGYNRLEKIIKETEVYNKLMAFNKESPAQGLFDDEEDLLFPVEVGNEFYLKAIKVFSEAKSLYDSIDKQLNKTIDKINKNEKVSNLINNSKFNNHNNSSSSSDDEEDKKEVSGQKRKSKAQTSTIAKTKRFKAPSQSESEKESGFKENGTSTANTTSANGSNNNSSPITKETNNNSTNSNSNNSTNNNNTSNTTTTTTTTTTAAVSTNNNKDGIPIGTLVAAREAKSNQWILAKVNGFNNKTQKYEVIDEDEEEQKKFFAPIKDVIQLPTPNNLPSFAVGTKVLAMFPDTTTFYTAVISQITKTKNKITSYSLHFDDDQEDGQTPNRRVNAQHVISYPK